MRHRFALVLGVAAAALAISSSALAFDCIRVSGSIQGLQQSTQSGNWLYFDMTSSGGGVAEVLAHGGIHPTTQQLACFQAAYDASTDAPRYFALGIGVAGGKTGNGPGVLAHNAPDDVLANGTGIDHIDDTVIPVLEVAAPTCLGP